MQIHKFIEGNKPIMVLIHGVLTPWQIWMPQIMAFKEKYNIYAVDQPFFVVCSNNKNVIFQKISCQYL